MGEALQGQHLDLYMTKLLDAPLRVMKYKVDSLLGRDTSQIPVLNQLKMFTYDSHDTQAVILLRWLNASNIEYP